MSSEVISMSPAENEAISESVEVDSPSPGAADSPSSERSPSKSSKSADPKVCGVCGDKALGNNFNAITCESCKAFFRRNALRTKEFVCPFSNNCKVDAITRRFCQRCRLKKCNDIGMKKEWIMTDEEKRLKKQKIEQNRLKRTSVENTGTSSLSGEDADIEGSPPAAKIHVTEQHHAQRSRVIGTGESVGSQSDNTIDSPKIQKQPMMPHNSNNTPLTSNPTHFQSGNFARRDTTNESEGVRNSLGKERTNVIAITVNGSTAAGDPSASCSEDNSTTANRVVNPPANQVPAIVHYEDEALPWIEGSEGDSSSSSCNQPPPLVKPPNKSHLPGDNLYMTDENVGTQDQISEIGDSVNQMPLLSSLIRPAHSESPSSANDNVLSPKGVEYDDPSQNEGPSQRTVFPVEIRHQNTQQEKQLEIEQEHYVLPHSPVALPMEDETGSECNTNPQSRDTPCYRLSEACEKDSFEYHSPSHIDDRHSCCKVHKAIDSRLCSGHRHCHHEEREVIPLPLNTMDSILSVAIAAEFNAFSMIGGNLNSKELNKAEQAKLSELLLASQALHAPVDAERPLKANETSDPSLINVINLTEIAIRRLIKMSKKISGFKNMCQEDQIALLKGGCTEMMILRSVTTYDPDRDSWQIPHSNQGYNINLGVLKEARGNLYEEHQRFVKSFRPQWRRDENIMIILGAISLFTPERQNVVHKDVVKLEQDSYYYLLKRYLESNLNGCEAKSTYLQLIRKIAELRALNSNHVRVFLEVNPKEVEPLLIEIFDLK